MRSIFIETLVENSDITPTPTTTPRHKKEKKQRPSQGMCVKINYRFFTQQCIYIVFGQAIICTQ